MQYLDVAASAAVPDTVRVAVDAALTDIGNPSSIHQAGQRQRARLEQARATLAECLGVTPIEVVFTSGGTESVNLALQGAFWYGLDRGKRTIIVPEGEHHATLDTVTWLERRGANVVWVPLDRAGHIKLDAWEDALRRNAGDVAIASALWVNNEVGVVQDVSALVALAHAYAAPIHLDAVAALGTIPIDLGEVGADFVSLSGHKVGAPAGIGALVVARSAKLEALIHGGGQERELRSGTQNLPGAVGFAVALEQAVKTLPHTALAELRDDFVAHVLDALPDVVYVGDPTHRAPNNAHFLFTGCEGDSLLFLLDADGLAAATGSACTAGVPQPSHVVMAMGYSEQDARGAMRFTFAPDTTAADFDTLYRALLNAVPKARAAGLADHPPTEFATRATPND